MNSWALLIWFKWRFHYCLSKRKNCWSWESIILSRSQDKMKQALDSISIRSQKHSSEIFLPVWFLMNKFNWSLWRISSLHKCNYNKHNFKCFKVRTIFKRLDLFLKAEIVICFKRILWDLRLLHQNGDQIPQWSNHS